MQKSSMTVSKKTIQQSMFAELKDKCIFDQAKDYGFEYFDNIFERNVFPTPEAIDQLTVFVEDLPDVPAIASEVIQQLHKYGSPATVAQVGGRYFGFVTGSVVPAGLAAKQLSIYWDQNAALQVLSPVASKLESVVQKWLNQLFGLPESTVAGFVSGTSMANFCGLAAARYRVLKKQGWDINEQGLFNAPKIRIVTGREAHSTVLKAISLIGLGKSNIEWVDVDDQGRIISELIPPLDNSTILVLQAGNVNSGSFDDFEAICAKAKSQGAWIHIDGAFGLWAGGSQRLKHLVKGYEKADSWAVDAHKTLNVPYDSGICLCADKEALVSSLHMTGGYIVLGEERDPMFFTPEMSRRARIVELWATMKYLGRQGIDELVYTMHQRAVQFAELLKEMEGFEVMNDVVFNQVVVCCATDNITTKTIAQIQENRECWVGGSVWKEKKVIRISVCSWNTTTEDIDRSANAFKTALQEVMEEITTKK